ncbi:MAG: tRNA lysidine(34) synthetase [Actinomycetaceae bacterium]|nr:tRNA lysidine(34) synthetase [Actinomycetaceae bacterium]
MSQTSLPRWQPGARETRLWNADAGGPLGEIQLAIKRAIPKHCEAILVVACSGGADSLALAAAMTWVAKVAGPDSTPLPTCALIVDHSIREESALEAQATADICYDLGFDTTRVLTLGTDKLGPRAGKVGPEGTARDQRWRALDAQTLVQAESRGLTEAIVFTGHTMDDQAETVLLGLARGSGTRSIAGMRASVPRDIIDPEAPLSDRLSVPSGTGQEPWSVPQPDVVTVMVSRPMLGLRRETTHAACKQIGIEPVVDPSNFKGGPWRAADGSPLRRAAVREDALPSLRESLGQDPVPGLARTAQLLQEDNEALDYAASEMLKSAWPGAVTWSVGNPIVIKTSTLARCPKAVLTRALRQAGILVGWNAGDVKREHLDAMAVLCQRYTGQGPVSLPGGVWARRTDGYLILEAEPAGVS